MVAYKDPELPSPMETSNLQLHTEQFSLKKTCKLPEQLLYNKDIKKFEEAEIRFHQAGEEGGISEIQNVSVRNEKPEPYIRHPNSWDLHWRDEPPKHLALKINGAYIQESQTVVTNRHPGPGIPENSK